MALQPSDDNAHGVSNVANSNKQRALSARNAAFDAGRMNPPNKNNSGVVTATSRFETDRKMKPTCIAFLHVPKVG